MTIKHFFDFFKEIWLKWYFVVYIFLLLFLCLKKQISRSALWNLKPFRFILQSRKINLRAKLTFYTIFQNPKARWNRLIRYSQKNEIAILFYNGLTRFCLIWKWDYLHKENCNKPSNFLVQCSKYKEAISKFDFTWFLLTTYLHD